MKYSGFKYMCLWIAGKLNPARLYFIFIHSTGTVATG